MLAEVERGEASYVTADIRTTTGPISLTDNEIRERMAGNLCRCGAYPHIITAIREVYGGADMAASWPVTHQTDGISAATAAPTHEATQP